MSEVLETLIDYVTTPHFGLTVSEAKLLRYAMQGIGYRPEQVPVDVRSEMAANLAGTLLGERITRDLEKKIQAMDLAKAAQLYYYMIGYLACWEID